MLMNFQQFEGLTLDSIPTFHQQLMKSDNYLGQLLIV